jgi:hypothetical protein
MARRFSKKQISLTVVATLAVLAVGAAAYVRTTRSSDKTASATTVTPNKSETQASLLDKGDNSPGKGAVDTSTTPGSGNASSTGTTTAQSDPKYNSSTLAAPTQTFNKSHTPVSLSQTDSNQPDYPSLDSTCMTVATATCEIHATLSGTAKTVAGPTTVTDASTGVDLPWNAKTVGLTPGTWTITAVAKLGTQTAASSTTTLEVKS